MAHANLARLTALLLALPLALAGCLGGAAPADDAADADEDPAAASAAATANGTASGPVAPKEAYSVDAGGAAITIHPYSFPGQTAREPVALDFSGEYGADDCAVPIASYFVGERWRSHSFADALQPGDAVLMNVTLTYENADARFADLHLWVSVPGNGEYASQSYASARGVITQSFEFQFAWAGDEDAWAQLGVDCWWAANAEPIPYALTARLAFGEGVVPAGNPVLVPVDEGVTELRVGGAALAPGATVTGHYRVFGPDDRLVGEFALNSDEAYDVVPVAAAGDHVIIVDHTENGMLTLGADAPPRDANLTVLETGWARTSDLVTEAPGPVDVVVHFEQPRVPLYIYPAVAAAEGTGYAVGKRVVVDIDGPIGRVWHRQIPMYAQMRAEDFRMGGSLPGVDEWEYAYDHHALAQGAHSVTVQADHFHGEVYHWWSTYLRPGEDAPPAPVILDGGAGAAGAAGAGWIAPSALPARAL